MRGPYGVFAPGQALMQSFCSLIATLDRCSTCDAIATADQYDTPVPDGREKRNHTAVDLKSLEEPRDRRAQFARVLGIGPGGWDHEAQASANSKQPQSREQEGIPVAASERKGVIVKAELAGGVHKALIQPADLDIGRVRHNPVEFGVLFDGPIEEVDPSEEADVLMDEWHGPIKVKTGDARRLNPGVQECADEDTLTRARIQPSRARVVAERLHHCLREHWRCGYEA
jgi:hypothetical protein